MYTVRGVQPYWPVFFSLVIALLIEHVAFVPWLDRLMPNWVFLTILFWSSENWVKTERMLEFVSQVVLQSMKYILNLFNMRTFYWWLSFLKGIHFWKYIFQNQIFWNNPFLKLKQTRICPKFCSTFCCFVYISQFCAKSWKELNSRKKVIFTK